MLLIDYFERTRLDDESRTFLHFMADGAADDVRLSYREADRRCSQYARILTARGIGRGHCIAMLQPNSVEWVLWYFAAQKVGAITCALNTDFSTSALAELLLSAQAKVIVADAAHVEMACELRGRCPSIGTILGPANAQGVESIERLASSVDAGHVDRDMAIEEEDVTAIIFSSGTTSGKPKAIQLSSRALIKGNGAYLSAVRITAADKVLMVTPIFHSCTLAWAITATVMSGATIVLAGRFSGSRFWEQADRSQATILWTMGTIIHILLKQHASLVEDSAAARLSTMFAAGMGRKVHDAKARWPNAKFVDGYGLTESVGTIATDDAFDQTDAFVCIGRPVPGIDLRIVDPDTRKDAEPRQQGEILLRFGQGFSGYLDNEVAMSESVRDGWFHTGDLAYADEEGRIYFVDRLKDIIRCGGKNIAASEIELALSDHPDISDVFAIPVPDDVLGEQVAVVLVAKTPGREVSLAEIQDYGASRLAPFKVPKVAYSCSFDELPRTPTGKVSKFELKRRLVSTPR